MGNVTWESHILTWYYKQDDYRSLKPRIHPQRPSWDPRQSAYPLLTIDGRLVTDDCDHPTPRRRARTSASDSRSRPSSMASLASIASTTSARGHSKRTSWSEKHMLSTTAATAIARLRMSVKKAVSSASASDASGETESVTDSEGASLAEEAIAVELLDGGDEREKRARDKDEREIRTITEEETENVRGEEASIYYLAYCDGTDESTTS